jgi:predicted transcriptional regulator
MGKRLKIFEQDNSEDSYYKISPQEYLELMKLSGYHGKGISKLPRFGGKPLWITGNLDLSNTPTDSLGNVGYIDGYLSISRTNISDLGNTKVRNYVADYGTPIEKRRIAKEQQRKRDAMDSYRTDGLWDLNDPNIDDEGLKANALFEYLGGSNELTTLDDDEKERLEQIKEEISELENRQENLDAGLENYSELFDEIQDEIDELESEMEELLDDKSDVYVLYPTTYSHYGLAVFEILDGRKDEQYTVGTEDEMDDAALEYAKSYIDDVGMDGFNQSFLEDYIDIERLKDYFEDYWRDSIYDSPESYFDDDDFELTPEQEKRIEQIEDEIDDYERQQNDLDPDREDYDELYDDFQNLIDELESEKDDIVPDTSSPTDDMVEAKVEEYLEDVENNPLRYIKNYGYDIKNFIDEDELAKGLVDSDGYGIMNSYDGDYDTIDINGETYYIMRIN